MADVLAPTVRDYVSDAIIRVKTARLGVGRSHNRQRFAVDIQSLEVLATGFPVYMLAPRDTVQVDDLHVPVIIEKDIPARIVLMQRARLVHSRREAPNRPQSYLSP